jgi:uroporphyrinogen-III decarboxylase
MPQSDYSSFQKGLRRFEKAMAGVPDRVPIFAQLHEFAMKETRAAAREFYSSPELLVPATLDTLANYGIDVPLLDYDVYNIEAEGIGQVIKYSDTDMPDVDRSRPLIRDRGDLKKIRTPDFENDGRFRQVIAMNKLLQRLIGGAADQPVQFCAPFSLAANIRGIEQLILDIYSAPRFARELFDRITEELLAPWILRLQAEFPETRSCPGADATASLPIVNLDILKNWVVPYVERLRDICGPCVHVPNWVGESLLDNPLEMLDLKRRVCPGFVEGQDPDVEKLGPGFYKKYAVQNGLPLILGIGAVFLATAKPAQVTKRVRHYLEVGGENGRFALYLCNLGATTPAANVRAAVAAVRKYGAY